MKFEFVEFYPTIKPRNKKELGTCHIYAIDCELDIRGIRIIKQGRAIHFVFPHFKTIDAETKVEVSYPFIRWTKPDTHKLMMDWLHSEVKPKILKRIENKEEKLK